MDEWCAKKGAVSYGGEVGQGPADGSGGGATTYANFPQQILNAARGAGKQRPCYWTVTKGVWWRLNEPNSARLRPEVAKAIAEASAHIAAQDWYKAGLAA